MLISEENLSVFRYSIFVGFCSILFFITLTILNLCTKKSPPAVSKITSIKASTNNNNNNNVQDGNGAVGQTKSQKFVATPNSPATTPANGETPVGTPAIQNDGQQGGGGGGGGGTKEKSLTADKPTKDEKEGGTKDTNDTKEKEDSFENHKPVIRDAKRADEIKKHGPVDQKRKDYKTLRYDIPSSDFDKSLGLPNLEEKEKEKQEAGK